MFDLLGLVDDVFIMRDRQTGTVWNHLDGKAVAGPLKGERLEMIPLLQTSWEAWLDEYPGTTVLAFDTGYQGTYQRRERQIGQFTITEALKGDGRLYGNTLIVGVEVEEVYKGYTLSSLATRGGVLNDELGGEPIVVVHDDSSLTGIAYSRRVGGEVLTFRPAVSPSGRLLLEDAATGTRWNLSGKGVEGPLSQEKLTFVPSIISEWYGWSAYHPQTGLFAAE